MLTGFKGKHLQLKRYKAIKLIISSRCSLLANLHIRRHSMAEPHHHHYHHHRTAINSSMCLLTVTRSTVGWTRLNVNGLKENKSKTAGIMLVIKVARCSDIHRSDDNPSHHIISIAHKLSFDFYEYLMRWELAISFSRMLHTLPFVVMIIESHFTQSTEKLLTKREWDEALSIYMLQRSVLYESFNDSLTKLNLNFLSRVYAQEVVEIWSLLSAPLYAAMTLPQIKVNYWWCGNILRVKGKRLGPL